MSALEPGLYESLITAALQADLDRLPDSVVARRQALHPADAADRIAWHISQQVERALLDIDEADRVRVASQVAQALLVRLGELAGTAADMMLVEPASVLEAILRRRPDGEPESLARPVIPPYSTRPC